MFSPTKVEAPESFLFTESSLVFKIKNTWLIVFVTLYSYITFLQCRDDDMMSCHWRYFYLSHQLQGPLPLTIETADN